MFHARSTRPDAGSPGGSGGGPPADGAAVASARRIAASAAASTAAARATPAASSGSAVSRSPAVSVSRTGHPSTAKSTPTASRVVPATGETIARPYPARALSSELFPAFGGPAKTTRHGAVRCRPNSAQRSKSRAAAGSVRAAAKPRASVPDA